MVPARHYPPHTAPLVRAAGQVVGAPVRAFQMAGHQATFVSRSLGAIPHAALHYRRHIAALIGDMTLGSSGIIVGGGTLAVLAFLGVAVGASIGIQGYALLDMVNMGPLTGLVSAYASTRELAPMIAAVGFAAQTGCRITAEIGSMRISEEVDALEANGIRSIPFVVSTRMVAGAITIVPLYLIALILGYVSCAFVVIVVHGESDGAYQHYFGQFISGSDIVYSVVKAVVFVVLIILIHSYFGYFASGGPEGVGVASGRAIRASLVVIVSADMVLTLMFWGLTNTIAISG